MDQPTLHEPRRVGADTDILPAWLPVPGFGILPANAFVIHAREPVLVDTGPAALSDDFMGALERVIDPADLRWIWLTHTDPDHVGGLAAVLAAAPEARVVTTWLGMGKLGLLGLPTDRACLVNPGQTLDVGDRTLVAIRPPIFDSPETTGLFDPASRALFSADCFGALMAAPAESAAELPPAALREGMVGWATVDAPWLQDIDATRFGRALGTLRDLQPERVLSSHLPPADGMIDTLAGHLAEAVHAPAFVGPDQAALEAMMAQALAA